VDERHKQTQNAIVAVLLIAVLMIGG